MEELRFIQRISCQFSSETFNYLQLTLFHPNGHILQHLLLIQNQKYQIQLFPSITHCYATTILTNRQEDFNLYIDFQENSISTVKEKQYQFEHFTLTVELQITSSHPLKSQQVEQMQEERLNLVLARSFLIQTKQKVILTLTKQNFIRSNKRKSRIIPKVKLRRSKTKKNLTAIFYRNIHNELIAKTFKKDMQKSLVNLTLSEQHQKQKMTNNFIIKINKSPFKIRHSRNSKQDKIILAKMGENIKEEQDKEARLQAKEEECKRERSIGYATGTSKSKYLENLERQTVLNLQIQKKQLDFLQTFITKNKRSLIPSNTFQQPEKLDRKSESVANSKLSTINKFCTLRLPK